MVDRMAQRRDDPWRATDYDRHFTFVSALGKDLIEWLAPAAGERILDLGCGTGTLAAAIAESGARVTGIDLDANMIEKAQAAFPAIPFRLADAVEFTVDEPQDAVFSNAALHWMTEPERVIARVAAALRPGGRFVAELGGKGNVHAIHESLFAAMEAEGIARNTLPKPWYFPSPAEYAALLEAHGFEVTDLRYFDRPTRLEGCDDGLRNWCRMFTPMLLSRVPPDRVDAVLARVEERTRPRLYHDGAWWADYRRLRFRVVRPLP